MSEKTTNEFVGKIIIIGASAAGVSAVKEIRKVNKKGELFLFSNEKHLPYYRPFLTEYLGNRQIEAKANFTLNSKQWFQNNDINLMLDEKVIEINTFSKSIKTSKNNIFEYDKLIIANGSSPFIPIEKALQKENVYAVRNFDDAKAVELLSREIKRVTIIGGGLLGLEAADALLKRGLAVTVIEFSARLLPLQLDPAGSAILEKVVKEKGVTLKLDTVAESLIGDETVSAVKLKSEEEIKTDLVIFSVGIRANLSLAKGCRLETGRGIIVNDKMETSLADIYACGDVAEFGRTPALWMPALKEGRVAGLNAIGETASFLADEYPAVLNSFGIRVYSIGDICASGDIKDYLTMGFDDPEKMIYKKLYFKNDRLCGGIMIGDIKKSMILSKSINQKINISESAFLLK